MSDDNSSGKHLRIEGVVDLEDPGGNVFEILAKTKSILEEVGYPESEIDEYFAKATSRTIPIC